MQRFLIALGVVFALAGCASAEQFLHGLGKIAYDSAKAAHEDKHQY